VTHGGKRGLALENEKNGGGRNRSIAVLERFYWGEARFRGKGFGRGPGPNFGSPRNPRTGHKKISCGKQVTLSGTTGRPLSRTRGWGLTHGRRTSIIYERAESLTRSVTSNKEKRGTHFAETKKGYLRWGRKGTGTGQKGKYILHSTGSPSHREIEIYNRGKALERGGTPIRDYRCFLRIKQRIHSGGGKPAPER